MAFLNPAILIALAAASIPLLLHLLNLRKLRRVDFSSLRFLKELQKTRIRRVKLKQWLLLLLRTALIIFAVLAFARPVLKGTSGLPGARATGTAVIILDNSVSMLVKDEGGERFRQGKKAALEILNEIQEGDEAAVVSLTDPGAALDRGVSRNRETVIRDVEDMEVGYGKASLADALGVAQSLLEASQNLNREIYIITDAQRINAEGLANAPVLINEDARVRILPVGLNRDVPANVGIDSVRIISTILEADRPLEIRAWVTNYGEERIENAVVAMYVEESRLAQTSVTLDPGASDMVELAAPPKRAGLLGGYVQVEGDNLEEDNRRYFAFRIVDGSRVAVVASPESARYLDVALGLSGLLRPQSFSANSLGSVDLSAYSAVVLADVPRIGSGGATRLASYVESGGGLVIWGGPSVDRADFNGTLGAALRLPLGNPVSRSGESPLEFGAVEKDHPVFAGVFDGAEASGRVESPEIAQALPPGAGDPVITMTNGAPFMSELRRGKGRVVYIAVPPSTAWSNLPGCGIFVPIAVRSALYVGAGGEEAQEFTVGENVLVVLPFRGDIPEQAQIVPPAGPDRFVPVRNYESGVSIGYDGANIPGIYKVVAAGKEVARFAVNMDGREGDLRPMEEDLLEEQVAAKMEEPDNVAVVDPRGDIAGAVLQSRVGLELWRYMLGMALLCAFVEMAVGRSGGKGTQE